jgi:hypothetical protein
MEAADADAEDYGPPAGADRVAAACLPNTTGIPLMSRTFYEIQHPMMVRGLRASGLIPTDVEDVPDKTPRQSTFHKEAPLMMYEKYVRNMDADGFISVRLCPSKKACRNDRFFGRVYGNGMAGLTRKIKHTLSQSCPAIGWEGYYDIDVKNCHPTILREVLRLDPELPPASYQHLSDFVDNRPAHLRAVETAYGVNTDDAKALFLSMFFGGSSAGWFSQKRDRMTVARPLVSLMPPIVGNLERELAQHIKYLIKHNPRFYNNCEKHEGNKAKTDKSYHKNPKGRFLSLWAQTKELAIIGTVAESLFQTTATLVKTRRVLVYEFDAIKLHRGALNTFLRERGWQMDDFLSFLSDLVFETHQMTLTFCSKPVDDGYDISASLNAQPEDHDNAVFDKMKALVRSMEGTGISTDDNHQFATHLGVASFIVRVRYKGIFIYFKDEWYCWDDECGGWVCYHHYGRPVDRLDRAINSVIQHLELRAEEMLMSLRITAEEFADCHEWGDEEWVVRTIPEDKVKLILKFQKVLEATKRNIGTANFHQGVISFARTEASVSELRFNRDPLLLGFPNGCYDFRPEVPVFRRFQKEDYVTMRCGISFEDSVPANQTKLNELLDRIFPDPEVREYALSVLGTALLGVPLENLFVFNGAGRNGKGLLDETMAQLLGTDVRDGYCCPSFSPATLCAVIESNRPYPELVDLECKRFVCSKEPPNGKKLNNGTVRALTGGQGITARRLHANTEPVTIHATWVLECNEKPPFQETPMMADMKRLSNVPFESIFTEKQSEVNEENKWFLCDPTLKSEESKRVLALELFHLLVPYARRFITDGLRLPAAPQKIINLTLEYVMDSFLVKKAFEELYYDSGDGNLLTAEDVLARIKESDFYSEATQAEKRVFKRDTFGKNLYEVFKLTYGTDRITTARHPHTQKISYTVVGFRFVGDA